MALTWLCDEVAQYYLFRWREGYRRLGITHAYLNTVEHGNPRQIWDKDPYFMDLFMFGGQKLYPV